MKVMIDYREQRSMVPDLLKKLGLEIEFTNLSVGDYLVSDIPIERKSISDYLSSLVSGHLNNQLFELSKNSKISYLVVEGYVSEALMYRKMKREPLISSLIGSSLKRSPFGESGQVITVNVETPYDTALVIKAICNHIENDEPRLPKFEKVAWKGSDELEFIVSSIRGIGKVRAASLLNHFKTLKNLVNASLEELNSVKGIGKKDGIGERAKELYEIFNRVYEGDKDVD